MTSLGHQHVYSNSFASKQHLLRLTVTVTLHDMSNKGQQVSSQTAVQGNMLSLATVWHRVLRGSLTCAPA